MAPTQTQTQEDVAMNDVAIDMEQMEAAKAPVEPEPEPDPVRQYGEKYHQLRLDMLAKATNSIKELLLDRVDGLRPVGRDPILIQQETTQEERLSDRP
jgi:hypothetical protein